MKKVVKKQLKEDEFVSTLTKIIRFFEEQTREIIVIGVLIAFVVLIFVGARLIRAHNLKKQSQLMGEMLNLRQDLDSRPENLAKLEKIPGTKKLARLSSVLFASYWVEKGDLNQAKAALEKMMKEPKDFVYYQAQDLLGQILMFQKDYDGAVSVFKKIEEEKPKDYILDAVLFHRAEALEKKGSTSDALALYKKIQEQFPQSAFGYDAAEKARKLESGK